MPPDTDLAIVGSGFGGSILAMIARRLGLRVVLLERGRHPRFAIGESASPLAGILLEQLAGRYDLPRLRPLSAYGPWRRTYPDVTCGLKRGFSFFKHEAGCAYRVSAGRANQLLVAATPNDEVSDTHWLRSDVDSFLVNEAASLGAEYIDEARLDGLEWRFGGDGVVAGTRRGRALRVRAPLVIDASGPRGFLSRALGIEDRGFERFPRTQALFSHFTGVARCEDMGEYRTSSIPPYPVDDAALHHVFDGGWMWVLRFGNGVTSAGVVVEDWLASQIAMADGAPAWARLLARFPSVAAQFSAAHPIREFAWMPAVSYRAARASGENWAMLPSAAAFVDPIFSTGIPMTLLGIERIAEWLERRSPDRRGSTRRTETSALATLAAYGDVTLAEAEHTARFVAGSFAAFPRFAALAAYSMFYFAAASYTEMARRLSSDRSPRGFLCCDSPDFVAGVERLSPARWQAGDEDYAGRVASAIEPWNVAGLCDGAKANWYGVDVGDTVRNADKLGLTAERARRLLNGPATFSSSRACSGSETGDTIVSR